MKKFTKNNESFVCYNCGVNVIEHPTSSRDHCNNCLFGLHVDVNPGDRANDCKGELLPIGLKINSGRTQIVYRCRKCSKLAFCIEAPDDNKDAVLDLSSKAWSENSI